MRKAGTASTSAPRNTQCQPTVSATVPATTGPTSPGTTQAAANPAKIDGWSAGG